MNKWSCVMVRFFGAEVLPNPSIERTPYGMLRMPPVAAHVER
jgi:hypothetical protein